MPECAKIVCYEEDHHEEELMWKSSMHMFDLPALMTQLLTYQEGVLASSASTRNQHSQTFLMIQTKVVWRTLTCRKTEIAKSASEPRLRGFFAGSALAKQYLRQKSLVI